MGKKGEKRREKRRGRVGEKRGRVGEKREAEHHTGANKVVPNTDSHSSQLFDIAAV